MGSIGPRHGFVADVREESVLVTPTARHRSHRKYFSNLAPLFLLLMMVSCAFLVQGNVNEKETQKDPAPGSVVPIGPGFEIYSLRGTAAGISNNMTSILFDSSDLPFELSSLLFTSSQSGYTLGATYYAGSGMILNVSGPSGNITMREPSGKIIRALEYQGQPSIVFNGETAFTSTPKARAEFEGTEILVQDWLKDTWSPELGVVLERPTGMTIDNSEFYVMVFQPQAPVPEFGVFPLAAIMMVVVCVLVNRFRNRASP